MNLQFLGATGTVTGSKYLLSTTDAKVLVDCGLFQGYKQLRLRNWASLPAAARSLDAIVLTHAHLDHSGHVPVLVRDGFKGSVFCTEATYDLCRILLPDSGRLQEEEAEYANRKGFSKHRPAKPLYTEKDALRALDRFSPQPYDTEVQVAPGLTARFGLAGHILGAATVRFQNNSTSIAFSGDLGRSSDLVMRPPAAIDEADYLVVESTYGNRRHEAEDPVAQLGAIIQQTSARGGATIVPSFAVGRAQSLLYAIHLLKKQGAIPPWDPLESTCRHASLSIL